MISKAQVKWIRSLRQKKYRKELGFFFAEGTKIASEIITSQLEVSKVYALEGWLAGRTDLKNHQPHAEWITVTAKELEQISDLTTPQEVLVVVRIPQSISKKTVFKQGALYLALDGIRDPGNLGTIIRIADWYGIEEIICSPDCVDAFSPKVVQASMGSIGRVTVRYGELEKHLAGAELPVYASVLGGKTSIHEISKFKGGIIIIGNESTGISGSVLSLANYSVFIPSYGRAESLNAGIATGILVDNFMRVMKKDSD